MEVKRIETKNPKEKIATVRILAGVFLPGVEAQAGEVYELPRHMARELVGHGLAETIEIPEDPDEIGVVQVDAPTNRDPKPKRVQR